MMTESIFKKAKGLVGAVLFFMCAYLTNLTFVSFAKGSTTLSVVWMIIAASIALLQFLAILQVKTNKRYKPNWIRKSFVPITTYVLCTLLTSAGSLIFSSSTIAKVVQETDLVKHLNNEAIETLEKEISILEKENEVYSKQITEYLEGFYVKLSKEVMSYKDENTKKIEEKRVEISRLRQEDFERINNNKETISSDTFESIASIIPLMKGKGQQIQYFIIFILSLTLEFGLFTTLEPMKKGTTTLSSLDARKELIKYIENLFTKDKILTDLEVSELTKIPIKQCQTFRKLLLEQMYDGKPILYKEKGEMKASFSKDDTIKLMTYYMKTQREED